ncbi:unnamed protein product, partial [Agarophyton chilense]
FDCDEKRPIDDDDADADAQPLAERELRRAERAEQRALAFRARRGGAYVDAALRARSKGASVRTHVRRVHTDTAAVAVAATDAVAAAPTRAPATATLQRSSLRKSTRMASARAAERRAVKHNKRKRAMWRHVEQHQMPTQQQRLEAAKLTEVLNRASLSELLRLEEEKKRVVVRRAAAAADAKLMSMRWRDGACLISFSEGVSSERIRHIMFAPEEHDEQALTEVTQ